MRRPACPRFGRSYRRSDVNQKSNGLKNKDFISGANKEVESLLHYGFGKGGMGMARTEISAGGVVYRCEGDRLMVQLITDRYGKISLPKGKMEPGETVEQTALREIEEETGIKGEIVAPVDIIKYKYIHPVHGEVDKEVHYYLVEAKSGTLRPQVEEISGVSWYDPKEAWSRQEQGGYDNNDVIVRKALARLGIQV